MSTRQDSISAPSLLSSLLRHYEELVDYVRSRFGPRIFAREIVHDVCVRLMERPAPEPVKAPLALLRRISHDMAVDRCRAEDARRRRVQTVAALPEVAAATPEPWQEMDGRQELAWLIAAIDAMPLRRRQVFVLCRIHELPQAEVAERMGITRKMVEKHLQLAARGLRRRS